MIGHGDLERRLAAIATPRRATKGAVIYAEGEAANSLFCITAGVVMTSKAGTRPVAYVTAFSYASDMIGLAAEGRYLETACAVTSASLLEIPLARLQHMLREDGELAIGLVGKLRERLCEKADLSSLLARNDALGKTAMFIEALGRRQNGDRKATRLYLTMRRSDLANHLGLTVETLSRTFAELIRRGIVRFHGRRQLEVTDGRSLKAVIANKNRKCAAIG
jgi:CRP-like cAMP-binding protein